MANNYILINPTGLKHASSLLSVINELAAARDKLALLKADADQMTDGATFTTVETAFGLPAGKGQQVYNLMAGAVAEMGQSNLTQLITWLGATR
jgi:hypothetical protein